MQSTLEGAPICLFFDEQVPIIWRHVRANW